MILSLFHKFFKDSLFRNSIYLMSATAVLAAFGFFFWLINAHLYPTEDVGFATTLISVMTLISIISLIGFNAALVRFLPGDTRPSDTINTALVLVAIAAGILSTLFVVFIPFLAPKLLFLRSNTLYIAGFILFTILTALNTLTDSVFLSRRQTKFILGINTLFTASRLLFPFFFVSFGAIGIFAAAGIAQGIGFLLSIAALVWKFDYRPSLKVHTDIMARVWHYSAGNYAASSLNLLPASVLPLLITHKLGPAPAAYYYIAMMIGNLLYVIPYATTRALFAEGSNDEMAFDAHIRSAIRIITLFMAPAIIVLIFASDFILHIFGAQYAAGGTTFLILVALAGLVVSASSIINSYFQVKKDSTSLIIVNSVFATTTIGLSYLFISPAPLETRFLTGQGLTGIGIAWILGNAAAALVGLFLYRFPLRLKERYAAISYELWVKYTCWKRFRRARKNGATGTMLFYPDLPKYYYVHYTICHELGLRMTNDLATQYDIAMSFKDITIRTEDETEKELARRGRFINGAARDISKEKVEEVFSEVFGYGMKIDPRTHRGECVQKSDENAQHDGKVVLAPLEPQPGYIYQKLINNREGDRVADLRVKVVGGKIPFMMYRIRSAFDRFDNTQTSTMVPLDDYIAKDEQQKILLFCNKMGIDFGALDCLRDADDGKLYIVDANLTTGTPMPGFHLTRDEFEVYVQKFSAAFKNAFIA